MSLVYVVRPLSALNNSAGSHNVFTNKHFSAGCFIYIYLHVHIYIYVHVTVYVYYYFYYAVVLEVRAPETSGFNLRFNTG